MASGISKHMMGLRAAGLVRATSQGCNRLYRIDTEAMAAALAPWLRTYEPYWTRAVERLRDLAEGRRPPPWPVPPATNGRGPWQSRGRARMPVSYWMVATPVAQ